MLHSIERPDTFLHKGLRKKLLEELQAKGISDSNVLQAMDRVPRHFFLDPAFERYAYEDRAFSIAAGQTISHPYTVAYQTQLLDVKPFEKVLEIGTGSAYQACVLAELGARVFTIERQKELFDFNNDFFFLKKYSNIKRFYGDGFKGLPSFQPFDKAIVTAGAPHLPMDIIQQLKVGGILIIPVNTENSNVQVMMKIIKTNDGFEKEEYETFSFVPMLDGKVK